MSVSQDILAHLDPGASQQNLSDRPTRESAPDFRMFQALYDDDEKDAVDRASPCVMQAFGIPAWSTKIMHLLHLR